MNTTCYFQVQKDLQQVRLQDNPSQWGSENTAALWLRRMEVIRRVQAYWSMATSLTSSPGPRNGSFFSVFSERAWIPQQIFAAVMGLKM